MQKSSFGGFFSVLIMIYMLYFVVMSLHKFEKVSSSDIKSIDGKLNLEEIGPIKLKDTDFHLFYILQKTSRPGHIEADELKRYVNISFNQLHQITGNHEITI